MWRRWLRALGARLARNLTTRLIILLMLVLMLITGFFDYARLVRVRERLVAQTQKDQRIFTETLALAVRQNIRRGRTTDELRELLEDILARPGLVAVVIYDPDAQMIAARLLIGFPDPEPDEAVRQAMSRREAASSMLDTPTGRLLRYVQPIRWPGGQTAAIEVRQTLEGLVAALAAQRRTDAQLAELTEIVGRGLAASKSGELDELPALNTRFHRILAEAAGNVVVHVVMASLREAIEGYVLDAVPRLTDWRTTSAGLRRQHAAILTALRRGDGDTAADVVDRHIHRFFARTR